MRLKLAQWLAGDFSNRLQAQANPRDFAHIRVFFCPLPWSFFNDMGFYSEQMFDHDLWTPYRQGVHRLIDRGDHVYVENYALKDSIRFAGAAREPSILATITPQDIERRWHCAMIFTWEGDRFRGCVEGNRCLIEKNGKITYLVSEVELTETTFTSWDRGMDVETNRQVWGSEHGALQFIKQESYPLPVEYVAHPC
ncbi:MAG: chromophore lyase CpcT/CpeT [Pseudanabaenaceae cyanobacterium]